MAIRQTSMSTKSLGSVLLYVLWILVVISILAFKLTSSSRVVTLNHSAVSTQLKNQMQISSATQFAIFKIISNQWKYKKYELNLNKQDISIQIYNEIGFISFYELRNRSLKNVFNLVNIDQSTVEKLENVVKSGGSMFTGFSVFAHELSHWIKDVRKNLPQHIQAVLDQREKDFIALVEQAQEYAGRNCEFSNDDYWEFMREHHVSTNGEVEIDIVGRTLTCVL